MKEIHYIDIPFGAMDYENQRLIGVELVTKEPLFEPIERQLPPEQQQVKELENTLLLVVDAELEGILL